MRILVLNGSHRPDGYTKKMVDAFTRGAESAGHEVTYLQVGVMDIHDCTGCNYCHGEGGGKCVFRDDMDKVDAAIAENDMVVFASPIYYWGMSGAMHATISRFYRVEWPETLKQAAMLLTSDVPGCYAPMEMLFKSMCLYFPPEFAGFMELGGAQREDEGRLAEVEAFGASMKPLWK